MKPMRRTMLVKTILHSLGQGTALILATLVGSPLAAQRTNVPDLGPYLIPERAAEVALARSAAPKQISDSATVLVLTRAGYVEAARGSNGFTCVVFRSFDGPLNDSNFWNTSIRAPHCFNPAATRTVLPAMLEQGELVFAGTSPAEIVTRMERSYAAHEFTTPAAGAMAYMLSPRQVLNAKGSHWLPHLMFYHDKSFPPATWGAGDGTVINASESDDHPLVLMLIVPVRHWSNGALASGS